jgi:hypothetical protein
MTKKSNGCVWKIAQTSYVFVTNPKFYKIEGLAKTSSGRTQRPAVQHRGHGVKSKKVFEEELLQSSGFDGLASKKDETD